MGKRVTTSVIERTYYDNGFTALIGIGATTKLAIITNIGRILFVPPVRDVWLPLVRSTRPLDTTHER